MSNLKNDVMLMMSLKTIMLVLMKRIKFSIYIIRQNHSLQIFHTKKYILFPTKYHKCKFMKIHYSFMQKLLNSFI